MKLRPKLRSKMFHVLRLALDRRVRGKMRKHQKERLLFLQGVIRHTNRFVGQPLGEIFAWLAQIQTRQVAILRAELTRAAIGPPEGLRRAPMIAGDVHIKAVRLREMAGIAQVPFSDQRGEPASAAQAGGECGLRARKIVARGCFE